METTETDLTTVKRGPKRTVQDQKMIKEILDASLICHIGQQVDRQVFVTPTSHWRDGDYFYWHAHAKARNVAAATAQREKICANVCLLDGLVLARSAFNHSVNYRSVTLFGIPELIVEPDEKVRQFKNMLDKFSPGRWNTLRPITDGEIQATGLARIPITEASAKVRSEGVNDAKSDIDWPVWAGVLPLQRSWGEPIQEPDQLNFGLRNDVIAPEHT